MSDTIAVPKERIKHLQISSTFYIDALYSSATGRAQFDDMTIVNALATELATKLVQYRKYTMTTEHIDQGLCAKHIHVDLYIIVPEGPPNE